MLRAAEPALSLGPDWLPPGTRSRRPGFLRKVFPTCIAFAPCHSTESCTRELADAYPALAVVLGQAVPDGEELATDGSLQHPQEWHQIGLRDRPVHEPEMEIAQAKPGHHRPSSSCDGAIFLSIKGLFIPGYNSAKGEKHEKEISGRSGNWAGGVWHG